MQAAVDRACADADDKVPGLERLAAAVHRHGGKLVAQLNHCGRQVIAGHTGVRDPVSASRVYEPLMGTRPRSLRADEIPGGQVPGLEKLIRSRIDFDRRIAGLPLGVRLDQVEATPQGIDITVTGENIRLAG